MPQSDERKMISSDDSDDMDNKNNQSVNNKTDGSDSTVTKEDKILNIGGTDFDFDKDKDQSRR